MVRLIPYPLPSLLRLVYLRQPVQGFSRGGRTVQALRSPAASTPPPCLLGLPLVRESLTHPSHIYTGRISLWSDSPNAFQEKLDFETSGHTAPLHIGFSH
ncbi:hypothetical protein AVEN_258000-1 [Araneus ventricosus]|uniref:Uncharacterized protein n=1 Tax=Araneus ventricosus TaxID=182803 RepID=A0A4Y2AXE9_ARAVE|nr:hypothetical protein AVEN_258000-1 [Araneus ventricosus]